MLFLKGSTTLSIFVNILAYKLSFTIKLWVMDPNVNYVYKIRKEREGEKERETEIR